MRKSALCVIMTLLLCVSCSTHTKIEYRDRDVNHYITQVVHDTLREHTSDSTYHSIIERNETVYVTEYHERTKWRDRVVEKHDTLWRDSIATEYIEKEKEVRYVPKIYRFALAFSIIVIIFVGIKVYKWLRHS